MRSLLVLLFCALSMEFHAQDSLRVDYDRDTRFYLGANFGATYLQGDVNTRVRGGYGLFAGYSFFKKPSSPIAFDVRAHFLGLSFEGVDQEQFRGILNDPVYSSYPYYRDSLKYAYRSFKTETYSGGLEVSLHLNALRERTGLDLYAFAGADLVAWDAIGNLEGDTSVYMWDKIEDSIGGELNSANISVLMDGTYDTPLEGSSFDKRNLGLMPTFGMGVGYQVGPNFSVGLEHRVTMTMTDLFEGARWNADNSLSTNKDFHHFTCFWIRFNILRKAFDDGTEDGSDLGVEQVEPLKDWSPQNPPTVRIVEPTEKRVELQTGIGHVRAQITEVRDRSKIYVWLNGRNIEDFQFDPLSGVLDADLELEEGANTLEISVSNPYGKAQAERVMVFIPEEMVHEPSMDFINPAAGSDTVNSESYMLRLSMQNVGGNTTVVARVNGVDVQSLDISEDRSILTFNAPLRVGGNIIEVSARNAAGFWTETVTIIRGE